MLIERMKTALIILWLGLFSGCASIPQAADKARYDATVYFAGKTAPAAIKAGAIGQDDADQFQRMLDAWKAAIDEREK